MQTSPEDDSAASYDPIDLCPQCGTPYPAAKQCQNGGQNHGKWFQSCVNKKADDESKSCSFRWCDDMGRPFKPPEKKAPALLKAYGNRPNKPPVPPPRAPSGSVPEVLAALAQVTEEVRSLKRRFDEVYPLPDQQ